MCWCTNGIFCRVDIPCQAKLLKRFSFIREGHFSHLAAAVAFQHCGWSSFFFFCRHGRYQRICARCNYFENKYTLRFCLPTTGSFMFDVSWIKCDFSTLLRWLKCFWCFFYLSLQITRTIRPEWIPSNNIIIT